MRSSDAAFARYLAVWNGDEDFTELDSLLSPTFRGHLGSRTRDARQLKDDIVAYRDGAPGVRFRVEHQFGDHDWLATRLTAKADGRTISGLNISRWEDGRLVEEWAVWETFGAD
jgi:hypothetical protein